MVSKIEKRIAQRMVRALMDYEMLSSGDRILVAVSGGKDSMTLLYHLLKIQRSYPVPFDVKGVHVKTDIAPSDNLGKIQELSRSWGHEVDVIDIDLSNRIVEGKKLNCWWCSTQRRTELLKYAEAGGFNIIALGHHMDDILETFLMNMMYKGELSTMMPTFQYDKYPISVIRPLALVKEKEVIKFAQEKGITRFACVCGYDDTSKRKSVRRYLEDMAAGEGEFIKENMYRAMGNPVLKYLPGAPKMPQDPEEGSKWL